MERLKIDLKEHSDNTALVEKKDDGSVDIHSFRDLLTQTLKVRTALSKQSRSESVAIGIFVKKSSPAIALLLGILEADFAFSFITEDDINHNELHKLGIRYFFSDQKLSTKCHFVAQSSLQVFDREIHFYKTTCTKEIRIFKDLQDEMNRICYVITTSGTTGQKKIIRVTYNSIAPNIQSLQRVVRLSKDVIYSSAPCTFDVFVLDLFLALHSGSALMIEDRLHRFSEESLKFMFESEHKVTFLQITPSLLQQYGTETIQSTILHPESSLKCLILGGEPFPNANEVLKWQDWNAVIKKRIFNIYGTTEMSCWAMLHEVTKDDLESGEVPLGTPLDNTNCAYSPNDDGLEEIILTSQTRVCFVDDKKGDHVLGLDSDAHFAQTTGDIVKRCNGKVFFCGRSNDVIKKFGERVDLSRIETIASEVISGVSCIYTKKKVVLFCKTDDEVALTALLKTLQLKLKPSEMPDSIRKINFFPLSVNGKISKHQLKEIYKETVNEEKTVAEESFLEAINQIFNLKLGKISNSDEPDGKRMKTDFDLTFRALGGTSFDALRVSMRLEDQVGLSNGLLPKLLGDRFSIRDIYFYLKELNTQNVDNQKVIQHRMKSSNINMEVVQRFNLDKCVDASPALLETENGSFISVGSHSRRLITINPKTLKIVSESQLGDRIEGEVAALGNKSALVGCYDGFLYSFDIQSGEIDWKFDSKAMVKSKPLVIGDVIIFGNYNATHNLWCLQRDLKEAPIVKWNKLVGSRGILAVPLLITSTSVLICALDGTLELISISDGQTIWSRHLSSPIFSSPQIIPDRNEILIAEVCGVVHCYDFDGNQLWEYRADGHIFSSFSFYKDCPEGIKILFGCHDKKLRCLNYSFSSKSTSLSWSFIAQSQIFGTPRIIFVDDENLVISCSTNGFINVIKLSDGSIHHSIQLPGEIFSTPVIDDRMMFVGCRNNFLYCIRFKIK